MEVRLCGIHNTKANFKLFFFTTLFESEPEAFVRVLRTVPDATPYRHINEIRPGPTIS